MHFIAESNTERKSISYSSARLTEDEGRKELSIIRKTVF